MAREVQDAGSFVSTYPSACEAGPGIELNLSSLRHKAERRRAGPGETSFPCALLVLTGTVKKGVRVPVATGELAVLVEPRTS